MDIAVHLMVGESISYAKNEILEAIRNETFPDRRNWYAVTTTYEENTFFYILSGTEYRHPIYHRRGGSLRLLGIAGSKEEAVRLVRDMVQHSVDLGNLMEMKTFLKTY